MSDTLNSVASDIIRDALLLLGAIDPNESVSPQELTDCRRALNVMAKSWQTSGYLWKLSDVTVTLTPGTQSYQVGPAGAGTLARVRPLRLAYAFRRVSSIDVPLEIISRQEYQDLPQKTQQGPPVSAYYDPQMTNGVLYFWYTGDTSNNTVICTFADPVDLFDSNLDAQDFPDEWTEALTYNLALRLSSMFGKSVPQTVAAVASESMGRLTAFDTEPGSIRFIPERR